MWSLFGLLAVGGFILTKYISDSSTTKAVELKREKAENINKLLDMTYDDEISLDESLKDDECREKLLSSINDGMEYIYCKQWRSLLVNSTYSSAIYDELNTIWGVIFHLLCAKNGKIVLNQRSYSLAGNPELCKQKVRACEIIERYIKYKHPDLELVFVPGWKISTSSTQLDYHEELCMGKLWWKHNLPVLSREQMSYVKKLW